VLHVPEKDEITGEKMTDISVYKILNKANGKFYVGYSTKTSLRFKAHINMLKRNEHHCVHLQRSWNNHGEEAFDFLVVETVATKEEAMKKEQEMLDELFSSGILFNSSSSNDLQKTILYAITKNGKEKSAESRRRSAKFIASASKNAKKAISPEAIAKRVAATKRNGTFCAGQRTPIIARPLNGTEAFVFRSVSDAARHLNIRSGNISACCLGKRHYANGYTFSHQLPHLIAFAEPHEVEDVRAVLLLDQAPVIVE
jgi:group I intron endonuclease